jgi:hypothetical protein
MMISRDDLKRLRVPIALCIALITAGVIALVAAERAMGQAQSNKSEANKSKLAAQDRVAKATEEEREIRENLVQFQQLVSWGMVGEEKRLDWVETIAQIRQQRKLFRINYDIEAQRVLDYPGVMPAGGVEFMSSRLKVDMPLLHEEDLLNFLADLQAARKAYMSPRRCVLERTEREAPPGGRGMAPRLRSDCQLDMISIREKIAR